MTEPTKPEPTCMPDSEINALWLVFGQRLRLNARRFLGAGRRLEDSEAIANAAFMSLIRYVTENEKDPNSSDDPDLWKVAFGIAKNKSLEANRLVSTKGRGGGMKQQGVSEMADTYTEDPSFFLQLEELMSQLCEYTSKTPLVRQIVERRLQGQSSKDIAAVLQVSESTVSRRLEEIRQFIHES